MKAKTYFLLCITALLLINTWWLADGMTRPIRHEDMGFSAYALALVETGLPLIAMTPLKLKALLLYHPPLYFYEVALFFKMFDFSPFIARLPGLLGLLTAIGLGCAFFWRWVSPASAALFLLLTLASKAIVQTVLITDIDGSILIPAAVALAWLQASRIKEPQPWNLIGAIVLWAIMLLAKWTTPVLLLCGWSASQFLIYKPSKALKEILLIAGGGLLLFGVVYVAWAASIQADPLMPLHLITSRMSAPVPWSLKAAFKSSTFGLLLLGLAPLLLIYWGRHSIEQDSNKKRTLIQWLSQAAAVWIPFTLLKPNVYDYVITWKYLTPSIALLLMTAVYLFEKHLPQANERHPPRALLLLLALVLVGCFIPPQYYVLKYCSEWWPFAALLVTAILVSKRHLTKTGAVWILAAVLLGNQAAYAQTAITRDRSSSASIAWEEKGLLPLVQYLRAQNPRPGAVLAHRDILFYLPGRLTSGYPINPWWQGCKQCPLENRPLIKVPPPPWWPFKITLRSHMTSLDVLFSNQTEQIEKLILTRKVDWAVDSKIKSFFGENPAMDALRAKYLILDKAFGDLRLYRIRH